jgi:cell division protein FtsI (penicillin-binding protein 3)
MIMVKKKYKFFNYRFLIFKNFLYFVFTCFLARALYLFFYLENSKDIKNINIQQYKRLNQVNAFRGVIFDRKGIPLSLSISKPSIAVNPKIFSPNTGNLLNLVRYLNISEKKILDILRKKKYFSWLKRQVSYETADLVKNLHLNGVYFILEPQRFYPHNHILSNLIGYAGLDHDGLFGMEFYFDRILKPNILDLNHDKDARGRPLITPGVDVNPDIVGKNIYLTIDLVIQEIAEEALEKGIKNAKAKSGFVVVSDPHSGKILAVSNYPNFNPNHPDGIEQEKTKNFAFSFLFEPASVIKPIVLALALEKNQIKKDTMHNCENGKYFIDKKNAIHDEHPKSFLTTEEILIYSSNICTYKVAQLLGKKRLYDGLKSFGFSAHSNNSYLPGFLPGKIEIWSKWSNMRFANIAFGQGFFASGLEVVSAYNVLVNGGYYFPPQIIEKISKSDEQIVYRASSFSQNQIISPETSKIIRESLTHVVDIGTGKNAKLESYSSGGKTGTSQKFDNETKKYSLNKRTASFVGFAPSKDPHLTVYIVIDEPFNKPYYGGTWAAPVFAEIAEKTLKYLNVVSDKEDLVEKISSL